MHRALQHIIVYTAFHCPSSMMSFSNPVFEFILSSRLIILSVFSTPSISLTLKMTSLAWEASRQRILQKMPYLPVAKCATVTSGTFLNASIICGEVDDLEVNKP